jgi:hypothetical protein
MDTSVELTSYVTYLTYMRYINYRPTWETLGGSQGGSQSDTMFSERMFSGWFSVRYDEITSTKIARKSQFTDSTLGRSLSRVVTTSSNSVLKSRTCRNECSPCSLTQKMDTGSKRKAAFVAALICLVLRCQCLKCSAGVV